ncbi:hypothetical protein NE237_012301 [Protea cynaroides]|uniref:GTD-binding domain-containing protein n=1 Tax=Protea cynaroides TaxID=273540 RepID=A0A9Q0JZ37_9MAGN|nr:hypothetical protein NE237_012301 [Protea cynaroides]
MSCQEIHSWTFCGLVKAFLDLWLAYLMLCGSALAFFTSKFLGIFGWQLPCPCNGLFGVSHGGTCLQKLLVDYPTRKISSIQMSVKNNFPFDSMWMDDQRCSFSVKLLGDTDRCDGPLEMEGASSCSAISDAGRRSYNFAFRDPSPKSETGGLGLMTSVPDDRADVKGKKVVNQRPSSGLRRRRRAVVVHRKSSSVSSSGPPRFLKRATSHSPRSMSEFGHDISEEGSVPMSSAGIALQDDREGHTGGRLGGGSLHGFELNGSFGESKVLVKDASSAKEFVHNIWDELGLDGNLKNVIRVLEQALEEVQAEHAALYLELEKERSAAATAADEAMAMILRLQKEKASIEMEARQYRRMIEEKSAYDAEEMDILKEILVRREKEKHFLEKNLETYRQLILLNNESLEGDANAVAEISALRSTFSLESSEDLEQMLRQISESNDKREIGKNVKISSNFEVQTVEGPSYTHAFEKEVPPSNLDKDNDLLQRVDFQGEESSNKSHPHVSGYFDDCNQEFQEKVMVSMDEERSVLQKVGQGLETESRLYKLNSLPKHGFLKKTIISLEHGQKNNVRQCQGVEKKADPYPSGTEINFSSDVEDFNKCGESADQGGSDQQFSKVETEPSLYDVYMVDDTSKLCKEEARESQAQLIDTASDGFRIHCLPFDPSGVSRIAATDQPTTSMETPRESQAQLIDTASDRFRIDDVTDQPSTSKETTGQDISRSCSDLTAGLPPISNIQGKSFPLDLRRNSMSAVDNERLKLDTEVAWLRERLRIVQEGREKLSFSVEHREGDKIQLQLLADIAKQLQEIRQLNQPGKAVMQISLPPTSSKVRSKKRRCRSVSLGLHNST